MPQMREPKRRRTGGHKCEDKAQGLYRVGLLDIAGLLHSRADPHNPGADKQQDKIKDPHGGGVPGVRVQMESIDMSGRTILPDG